MLKITPPLQYTRELDAMATISAYGLAAAPAAGSEIAITAGVVAGKYKIFAVVCPVDTAAPGALIQIELRTANDLVTLEIYAVTAAPTPMILQTRPVPLTTGVHVRAINGTAGAAGSVYFARIDLVLIP